MTRRPTPVVDTKPPAVFVGSELFQRAAFGKNHPLAIARVEKVSELCVAMGWFGPDHEHYRDCQPATDSQLGWFHDADYLAALKSADRNGRVSAEDRKRYGFGTMENPLFPGVYERAATSVGGSIFSAELALEGRVVFHPAGGTHHAARDRARGFCYFNDPVFAILRLLAAGTARVLYIDLDAHHGDGVQSAFADDARVRTISVHEAGRWPNTGDFRDIGSGFACNIPVPARFNDRELNAVAQEVILPLANEFEPQAVVMTCGADACIGDPLSSMLLSNQALWSLIAQLTRMAPASVVVGGGGYNPWTLTRYWAGLWATLANLPIPEVLPDHASRVFDGMTCDLIDDDDVDPLWRSRLGDDPGFAPVRRETQRLIKSVLDTVPRTNWKAATIPTVTSAVTL